MKLPAKILIWSLVLIAPAAAFAQRGGGGRSREGLRIGGRPGGREEVRSGFIAPGLPIYYEPLPFAPSFYPYSTFPYTNVSTVPTYSLSPVPPYETVVAPTPVPVPPAPASPASASVQALTTQVQALTAEVQRLRSDQSPQRAAAPEPVPAPVVRDTTLVFRDNHRMAIQSYAIIGSTLRVLDKDNSARIAIADLDLDATRRVNQENGIRFAVPSAQ